MEAELKKKIHGVKYIKLHGCINCIEDADIPLILSTAQYVRHTKHRDRLFDQFKGWGRELTIIFCGYSLADPNIQTILFDLFDDAISRPRYYAVLPDLDEIEKRYWESHRITVIDSTFSDFMEELSNSIPEFSRSIPKGIAGGTQTINKFYRQAAVKETSMLVTFLKEDADHVRIDMPSNVTNPKQFYVGYDNGWGPIEKTLDVRRTVTDTILVDVILTNEEERDRCVELFAVKGPAGQGKSTTLKRIAMDAAIEFSRPVIFMRDGGAIRVEALREMYEYMQQRIFLFVDHAALWVDELTDLLTDFSIAKIPLTVVTAERDNEWNVRCSDLDNFLVQDYPLTRLSEREIEILLEALETHSALGMLDKLNHDERVIQFRDKADRQLLVALHEATLGKPFEEIIADEYERITPAQAQDLYLDVCTLNRLGIAVRAGLISRISGITFNEFKKTFFEPLQLIVRSYWDRYVGDYMYSARHPHIAELVFEQVLADPEKKYDQLIRVLEHLNIDFSSDAEVFRSITRGRTIIETFHSHELGRKFYQRAVKIISNDPYIFHQMGVFEMNHPGGSLVVAEKHLSTAFEMAPYDRTIKHTLANLARRKALIETNPLQRQVDRSRARGLISDLTTSFAKSPHGFSLSAQLKLDELKEVLNGAKPSINDEGTEHQILNLSSDIEKTLAVGSQRFPKDPNLSAIEADLLQTMNKNRKAIDVLKMAFDSNPRLDWIAKRLAIQLAEIGDYQTAKSVLVKCTHENPGSKFANHALAKLYLRHGSPEEKVKVLHLLRRSFTDGDNNFDAQFWYARELFLANKIPESELVFITLKMLACPLSLEGRSEVWCVQKMGKSRIFSGRSPARKRHIVS